MLRRISFDRNIVQFYGACLETKPPMLVMEYMGVRTPFISATFIKHYHSGLQLYCMSCQGLFQGVCDRTL